MSKSYYSIIEPILFTACRLETIANRYLFGPKKMTVSTVKILRLLEKRGSLNSKDILEKIGGTKSNISQRLAFLEKKGYIKTRRNVSTDKRKLFVKLTPLGKEKFEELKKHLRKVKLELESNFSKEEIQKHFDFFNKLNKFVDLKEKSFSRCKDFCK